MVKSKVLLRVCCLDEQVFKATCSSGESALSAVVLSVVVLSAKYLRLNNTFAYQTKRRISFHWIG